MAIKKISEFVSAVPSSDSKILFEQNEKGKSCTIGDAVNTCSLSYEEIMATNPVPDLTGKVASAEAVKSIGYRIRVGNFRVQATANTTVFVKNNLIGGVLPTTVNTVFTIVTNNLTVGHTTTLFFDEYNADKLIILSNVSQVFGVNWISFY